MHLVLRNLQIKTSRIHRNHSFTPSITGILHPFWYTMNALQVQQDCYGREVSIRSQEKTPKCSSLGRVQVVEYAANRLPAWLLRTPIACDLHPTCCCTDACLLPDDGGGLLTRHRLARTTIYCDAFRRLLFRPTSAINTVKFILSLSAFQALNYSSFLCRDPFRLQILYHVHRRTSPPSQLGSPPHRPRCIQINAWNTARRHGSTRSQCPRSGSRDELRQVGRSRRR